MNRIDDSDLREVLQRRGGLLPEVDVPDDFMQRVMSRIEVKENTHKTRKIVFAALAMAASFALLLVLFLPMNQSDEYAEVERKATGVSSKEQTEPETFTEATVITTQKTVRLTVNADRHDTPAEEVVEDAVKEPATELAENIVIHKPTADDEAEFNIALLEQKLSDIRDSCYMLQVERMIMSDEQLCHIMNEMINN